MALFSQFNNTEAQSKGSTALSKINLYIDFGYHAAGQASLNLETKVYSSKKITWYGRGGIGAASVLLGEGGPGILGAVTMLTGKNNGHFELNGGAFFGKDSFEKNVFVLPLIDIGYRYQKPKGGFIFKAKAGILGIGIGLGYAF